MKKLHKVFSTLIIFYIIVKITDVCRNLIIAAILGVSFNADVYLGVLNIPDLLLIIIGFDSIKGVVNSEFSSLKAKDKLDELWRSYIKLFYIFTFSGAILLLLFIILRNNIIEILLPGFTGFKKDLAVNIFLIITPVFLLKIIFSLSQAVSNAFQKYYIPIIVPILINVAILASLLFTPVKNNIIYNFAYGVTIGNFLVIVIMLLYNVSLGAKFSLLDFKPDNITKRVLKNMSLILILVIINQLFFASRNYFASYLPEGSISVLNYSSMVPGFISVFIFTVFFNVLLSEASTLFANNKYEEVKILFFNIMYSIFYFIIPIVISLIICKINILEIVFLRGNFSEDKIELLFKPYIWETLSLIPFVIFICFVSLYLAAKKYKLISKIGVVVFIIGIILNYLLSQIVGLYGLSLSYFITGSLYAFSLFFFSTSFIGNVYAYLLQLIKMLSAGIIVFILLLLLKIIFNFNLNNEIIINILIVGIVLITTFIIYYLITYIFKINYFKKIFTIIFEFRIKL